MTVSLPIKSIDEINLIKNFYKKQGEKQYLLMFSLSINTGIELKKLLDLKVKDVKGKNYFACDKQLAIPLTQELKDLISQVAETRKDKEDYLFLNSKNEKFDRTWVFRAFKKVCNELGLSDKYSVASWRKTFAYHYYEKYKDISYLMWLFNQPTIGLALKFIDVNENVNLRFREGVCL